MKVEIQAGAKFETLTPQEMSDILSGWQAEMLRGARFLHPGAVKTVSGAGVLAVTASDNLGPREGFLWEVTRVMVSGLTAAQTANAFVNDASPIMAVGLFTATAPQIVYGQRGLILNAPDKLLISGTGLTANADYYVSMQVTELPVQLAGRLL
jgi:hypothetical protein